MSRINATTGTDHNATMPPAIASRPLKIGLVFVFSLFMFVTISLVKDIRLSNASLVDDDIDHYATTDLEQLQRDNNLIDLRFKRSNNNLGDGGAPTSRRRHLHLHHHEHRHKGRHNDELPLLPHLPHSLGDRGHHHRHSRLKRSLSDDPGNIQLESDLINQSTNSSTASKYADMTSDQLGEVQAPDLKASKEQHQLDSLIPLQQAAQQQQTSMRDLDGEKSTQGDPSTVRDQQRQLTKRSTEFNDQTTTQQQVLATVKSIIPNQFQVGLSNRTQTQTPTPIATGGAAWDESKLMANSNVDLKRNSIKDDDDDDDDDSDNDDDDDDDDAEGDDHLLKKRSQSRGLFDFKTEFPDENNQTNTGGFKKKKKQPSLDIKDLHGPNTNEQIQTLRNNQQPQFHFKAPSLFNQHHMQQLPSPPPPPLTLQTQAAPHQQPFRLNNPFGKPQQQQQQQQQQPQPQHQSLFGGFNSNNNNNNNNNQLSKKPKKVNIYKALLGSISIISILGVIGDLSSSFSQSKGQEMVRGFVTKLVETMVEFMVHLFSQNNILTNNLANSGANKFFSDMLTGSLVQAIEKPIVDTLL